MDLTGPGRDGVAVPTLLDTMADVLGGIRLLHKPVELVDIIAKASRVD